MRLLRVSLLQVCFKGTRFLQRIKPFARDLPKSVTFG
jgi:hypothetical protein